MAKKKQRARPSPEKRRDELLRAFEAWTSQRGGLADVDSVRLLLDFRSDYLDSNLACWRASDLSHLLLGLFPRKVVLDAEEVADIVPAAGAFLHFMAATGRLDAGSDPLEELDEELEEIEEAFPEAMSDRDAFGMAKALAMAMEAEGVDITDPSALQAWIGEFNARPEAERRAMVPDAEAAFGPPGRVSLPEDIPIPPVRIAPEEELSRAARDAPVLDRLRRFVGWVGDGRRLTDSGRPKLRDIPELVEILGFDALPAGFRLRSLSDLPHLEWIYALADEGLLVDVDPRGLVVTDLGRDMATRPLEAWESVFEGLLDVGIAFWFRGQKGWHPAWTQLLDGALPDLLVLAYLNGREGLPPEEVVELAWSETARNLPGDEAAARKSLRSALASDVARLVEALADLGIVESGPGLTLSPLGVWAVNRLLTGEGYSAASVDYGPDDDAATLLMYWGSLDPDRVLTEIDGWLAARTPEAAVAFLADGARNDPVARSLFFFVLERLGPEASAAVSLLQDDPSLGHYVSAWRVGRGLEEAGALPDEALHRMMVDQLASMLISGGPEDVIEALKGLGPPGEQAALVEALGKIATPEAAQVLQAVAAAHPDAAVSRAARKGQFRREQPPRAQGAVTSPRKRPRRSGRRSGRHSH